MELALEALKGAETFASGNSKMISLRGYILAMSGRRNEAAEALRTLETIAHERHVPPTRSLSYAPALDTANERWSGSNAHTRCGTSICSGCLWMRDGTRSQRNGVRRTDRTLQVHHDHPEAIGDQPRGPHQGLDLNVYGP